MPHDILNIVFVGHQQDGLHVAVVYVKGVQVHKLEHLYEDLGLVFNCDLVDLGAMVLRPFLIDPAAVRGSVII